MSTVDSPGTVPLRDGGLPDAAWRLALLRLPRMGPRRIAVLLDGRSSREAWELVRSGRTHGLAGMVEVLGAEHATLPEQWAEIAIGLDPTQIWQAHLDAGVHVTGPDDDEHPDAFRVDPEPPVILCSLGDRGSLDGARVAVVGTRRCTSSGRAIAHELGSELADAGVRVVSGLALGIDAAAHRGALAVEGAPPIGVVANGLDVIYPRRHRELYLDVASRGVLMSEYPLGASPQTWTFPARNRLIAALADLVVVVESHRAGGSLYTVDEAECRSVPVFAVPGSVRSPASAGSNRLLVDGCGAVRDAVDVLVRLGLESATRSRTRDARPRPGPGDREVLEAVGWEATPLEQIMSVVGQPLAEVHERLDRLEDQGWVRVTGGWVEQVSASEARP